MGRFDVGAGLGGGPHVGVHPGPAQQQVGPPGRLVGAGQPQGLAVEAFGHRQGLGHLGPASGLAQPVESLGGDVVGHPGDRAQVGHQVGRGAEVEGHHVDQAFRGLGAVGHRGRQVGGDAVVAPGPVGLGQGAVGHLADEIGAEHPVLAVDLEDLLVVEADQHRIESR